MFGNNTAIKQMRRGDLLKKGAKTVFDRAGSVITESTGGVEKNFVKDVRKMPGNMINGSPLKAEGIPFIREEIHNKHFRLQRLEKYYFKWMTVGRDMRVNVYAVFACFVCFAVVFFPANYYDERHFGIQLKGRISKESLDRDAFKEYMVERGKATRFDWDSFRDFHTI